jgi:hypothetical protein
MVDVGEQLAQGRVAAVPGEVAMQDAWVPGCLGAWARDGPSVDRQTLLADDDHASSGALEGRHLLGQGLV